MKRPRRSRPLDPRRLRPPVLALLAGAGFVVAGGGVVPLSGPAGHVAVAWRGTPDSTAPLGAVLPPDGGLAALLEEGGSPPELRVPGGRSRVGSGAGSRGGFRAQRSHASGAPAEGVGPGVPPASLARDALARAGRLSAPSTAPPVLPS